jgi:hypothetical protein
LSFIETNKDHSFMPRKRAAGGGRKPQGDITGKSAAFATRITPEVRRWLEAKAKKAGKSLSQIAENALIREMRRETDTQQRNHALGHSIARLAESIERDTGKSWLDDQFTGQALRYAVEAFVFHFAPTPEQATVPPAIEVAASRMLPEIASRYRTPAGFGHMVATHLITEMELSTNPPGPPNEWSLPITFRASADELKQIGREL